LAVDTGKAPNQSQNLDTKLPARPEAGFYGRDETLLALDRAFEAQSIVLLHGLAGSGKTAAVAEFARWYVLTGGLAGGPVLFTSFEHYIPLRSALSHFGVAFCASLEEAGVNWSAISDMNEMRRVALRAMKKRSILWIWDNIEPVTGFPKGTPSSWKSAEQKELVDFLRDARNTKARFLLTSRRDERDWLGDLPTRISIPNMPMQERVQLTRSLVEKHGGKMTDVNDWGSLLKFTQGNPLTIRILVGQALYDKLHSEQDIEVFVAQLRAGEAQLKDEASKGRSHSLSSSLAYGFRSAFKGDEQKVLALLHVFQGFLDVATLHSMGIPGEEGSLPELYAYDRNGLLVLLNKATETGLLTTFSGGYFRIHPALPWFFKDAFDRYYGDRPLAATRAFVIAIGKLSYGYHREYNKGNHNMITLLTAEEDNLLKAWQLARAHGWWHSVVSIMQGLGVLYHHTGRRAEWRWLVDQSLPEFVNLETDSPLQGREEFWSLVTEYRAEVAREDREWSSAQRLQQISVNWNRRQACNLLNRDPRNLIDDERDTLRTLALSIRGLGEIQQEQGLAECVDSYEEAFFLLGRIGDKQSAANCALHLGYALAEIDSIRAFHEAESWFQRSLEMLDPRDLKGQAQCLRQLGYVTKELYEWALASHAPRNILRGYINKAIRYNHNALKVTPEDAVQDMALVHDQLGGVYYLAALGSDHHITTYIDKALEHYRESIRYREMQGDIYGAGSARINVAMAMLKANRLTDALEYAHSAMVDYQNFDGKAKEEIQKAQRLINRIRREKNGTWVDRIKQSALLRRVLSTMKDS